MIRALALEERVDRRGAVAARTCLCPLLQRGLGIAHIVTKLRHHYRPVAIDEGTRHFVTAIEIESGNNRFAYARQNRRLAATTTRSFGGGEHDEFRQASRVCGRRTG